MDNIAEAKNLSKYYGNLEVVSRILPSTHLNDAFRMVAVEGKGIVWIWKDLLIVGAWLAGALVLSIKFFK